MRSRVDPRPPESSDFNYKDMDPVDLTFNVQSEILNRKSKCGQTGPDARATGVRARVRQWIK